MPRARWWVIGVLGALTATVVLLDATSVIFDEPQAPAVSAVRPPAPPTTDAVLPASVTPVPAEADSVVVAKVERLLGSAGLGASVHAVVAPLADPDRAWADVASDGPATPASTLKLWTGAAVLDAFDPSDRLSTSVVWDEPSHTLVLVGGGDATLQTTAGGGSGVASLTDLARQAARELKSITDPGARLTLDFDTSLFTGPAVSPDWESTYVTSGVIAPVTALMVDQGMVDPPYLARYPDPARAAADIFADLLAEQGIDLAPSHRSVDVDELPEATEVAAEKSPQINALVEMMLRNSDNQLAESLGRLAAGADNLPRSFKGAAHAVVRAAQSRGVDTSETNVVDASGLSRDDRFTASGLLAALSSAADEPELAPLLSGLAVAGFDGTLADRFQTGRAADAAGLVRAKTGTLTGISAEAGVATSCDGDLIGFVLVADAVADTESARSVLDDVAAALTDCS